MLMFIVKTYGKINLLFYLSTMVIVLKKRHYINRISYNG